MIAKLNRQLAVISASRTIFGSIFTAAFTAIYTNKVPGYLTALVPPAVTSAGLASNSVSELMAAIGTGTQAAVLNVTGMNTEILHITNIAVSTAYSKSYAYVYYFAVALGGLAIIASVCLRDFDQYLTEHVSRQLYHRGEADDDPLGKADVQILREQNLPEVESKKLSST